MSRKKCRYPSYRKPNKYDKSPEKKAKSGDYQSYYPGPQMYIISDKFGEIVKFRFTSLECALAAAGTRALIWKREIFVSDPKSGKSWTYNSKGEKSELK